MLSDTRQTLAELARNEFKIDPAKLERDEPITALGIDSLGLLEYIFRIEEVFGIRIDAEHADKLKTLSDIVNVVDELRLSAAS